MNFYNRVFLVLLLLCYISVYSQQLRVLYFNDAHELAPIPFKGQQVGGIAKVAHVIQERRDHNTLVLFGGDLAGGTLSGKVFKGDVMVKALNQMKVDVANPGQHEFDHGIDNFIKLKQQSKFPWVSSNLIYPEDSNLFLPYYMVEKNNLKIGIIGLTDKINTSQPGLPLIEKDMAQVAQEIINAHPENHIWIAITQMAMEKNEDLQQLIPKMNLILTEESYHDRTQIIWHEQTPIIAASGNAGDVVEVNIHGKDTHIRVHSLRSESLEHQGMQTWVRDSINRMNQRLSKKLAYARKAFPKEETKFGERVMGNLVTDAFRAYYKADLAIIQGGGIREGMAQGDITLKHVYQVLPFDNDLVLAKLSGKEIKAILNKAIVRMMPQVSGIELVVSRQKENPIIKEVFFKGEPIKDDQVYLVSLPAYIADGGGNYDKLDNVKILKRTTKDADVLIWYLQQKKQINPLLEGRIML